MSSAALDPKKQMHYSGKKSEKFWKRVHELDAPTSETLWHAGVLLQEMEERVLLWLVDAEKRQARKRSIEN